MMIEESYSSNKPYLFRAIYEWLLDNDATPYLLVDATVPLVSVPSEHVQNGQIVLNASPTAVRNWVADNEAISFSARFSGKSRQIYVPVEALLAVYSQENGLGMAFPAHEEIQVEETAKTEESNELEEELAEKIMTTDSGDKDKTDIGNKPKSLSDAGLTSVPSPDNTEKQKDKKNNNSSKKPILKVIK